MVEPLQLSDDSGSNIAGYISEFIEVWPKDGNANPEIVYEGKDWVEKFFLNKSLDFDEIILTNCKKIISWDENIAKTYLNI